MKSVPLGSRMFSGSAMSIGSFALAFVFILLWIILAGVHHIQNGHRRAVLFQNDNVVWMGDKLESVRCAAWPTREVRVYQIIDLLIDMSGSSIV